MPNEFLDIYSCENSLLYIVLFREIRGMRIG